MSRANEKGSLSRSYHNVQGKIEACGETHFLWPGLSQELRSRRSLTAFIFLDVRVPRSQTGFSDPHSKIQIHHLL